jgi:hypothetical protein
LATVCNAPPALLVEPVVQHRYGLVLDPEAHLLYFVDNNLDKLLRCELDGSNRRPGVGARLEGRAALKLPASAIWL